VLPIVTIPPDYPPEALRQGIEGWVRIEFTIAPDGGVRDAVIDAADPPDVFDQSALQAVARWRYNPPVRLGSAGELKGVQTIIRFELTESPPPASETPAPPQ
jgi:protein TonB